MGPRPTRRASVSPSRPLMSIASSAPVMASKPVAKHDAVDVVVDAAGSNAGGRDLVDRCFADVDQLHVRPVERLVVAGVDTQAFAPDDRSR